MSERLKKMVSDALITKGIKALQDGSGLGEQTIREISEGHRFPRRKTAYRLAKACGAEEEEALALARECLQAKRAMKAS